MALNLFQGWAQRSLGGQDNRSDDHVTFSRDYEHERVLDFGLLVTHLRILVSFMFRFCRARTCHACPRVSEVLTSLEESYNVSSEPFSRS